MITVLGAKGFIGSHLLKRLSHRNEACYAPHRFEDLTKKNLGKVIYCIGVTADFRTRPFDTVDAHVCKLLEVIQKCHYEKIMYLSSTRIYNSTLSIAREESILQVDPADFGDLYNISKLMGESIVNTLGDAGCVVRLSNVYGRDLNSNNFLAHILRDALAKRVITLESSMDSEKDYIHVENVVDLLLKIAEKGSRKVYNIASGMNISNRALVEKIISLTGCDLVVRQDAKTVRFPPISINAVRSEFNYNPPNLLADLEDLVKQYKRFQGDNSNDNH
jgi:nucleoside-diphosphate-sugar epimerase